MPESLYLLGFAIMATAAVVLLPVSGVLDEFLSDRWADRIFSAVLGTVLGGCGLLLIGVGMMLVRG